MARLVFVFALVACGGGGGGGGGGVPAIDAALDAVAVDAPAVDAVSGALCTGAVYDPCTVASITSTECISHNCRLYGASSLTVCTQTCSATVPCPNDSTGAAVACNGMGNCKPSVANNCHR